METIYNGYTLELSPGAFPLSTDSMVLADFIRLPKNAKVLDLGSGCGTLGLLLCAKDPGCFITGIELDRQAHAMALTNSRRNGIGHRLISICSDLRRMPPGDFHCVISNPPYFTGGAASLKTPLARRDDSCTTEDLFAAASRSLRWGGDFFLVHRPDRLAQLCYEAGKNGMEPKVLRIVRHRPDVPPSMILLQCRKGGKPGLKWEELTLHHPDGTPTEDYRRIYHI